MSSPRKKETSKTHAIEGHESGFIEAVEITRMMRHPASRPQEGGRPELFFSGKPVSKRSRARSLHVAFVEEDQQPPQPMLDPATGRIDLYYSKSSYSEVHALLTSRSARLCYFWRSRDGGQRRAWLVTSPH